jgi:sigma-E factor negative regulatory protein RseC
LGAFKGGVDLENQEGIVLAVQDDMAKVKVARHSSCENCGACPGNMAAVLDARNIVHARPGQRVVVEIKQVNMLQAAFVVYMLPLIAIFGGVTVGSYLADYLAFAAMPFQFGGGLVGFLAAILYIRFFDRSASKNSTMQPVIIRILSE